MAGSASNGPRQPLWLLAELTYRCPLQCFYCSNPIDFASRRQELKTEDWLRVLGEARELGAVQLGFSGGEPLLRKDFEELLGEAKRLGFYTNLITSGMGMDEARLSALRRAGLDHIQLSFQAADPSLNDFIAGAKSFEHKKALAKLIKAYDYPMVLNVVLHRGNIDSIDQILEMAEELGADYVELANAQYGGWATLNRKLLLPSREQLRRAELVTEAFRERIGGSMRVFFVAADYFENRPKPCAGGWGNIFMQVTPDGTVLPCHGAQDLPGMHFPNVREAALRWIWEESPGFERFRGESWMKEPCRSCPEREKDFGGCRCQAFALTGEPANADPVCSLSPHHALVTNAIAEARAVDISQLTPVFRTVRNSKKLTEAEP